MTTEQVREAARRLDGRFGEQPKADAGQLDLASDGWVQDGVTPHPTGGYVRVVVDGDRTRYLDIAFKLHREDGPAVTYLSGAQTWYQRDVPHREDGPAVIHAGGTQEWWLGGALHRSDGPAVINSDGTEERWIHGEQVDPPDPG